LCFLVSFFLDALIAQIKNDISVAEEKLEDPKLQELCKHTFFVSKPDKLAA
jgi:hypothetical protein